MNSQQHIDSDSMVRAVADKLGVSHYTGLREEITKAAIGRVETWMQRNNINPSTLDDVHAAVLHQTGLKIERIEEDADLQRIQDSYACRGSSLPVQLELEFNHETEALVFQRQKRQGADFPFVAVVDARGNRKFRAWFAERHEPSHLVIPDPTAQVLWRRTQLERPEPIEQVVDAIASALGFWEPIVRADLDEALKLHSHVLDAFEAVRLQLAPKASRESCYRAFTALVDFPLLLIRVDYDCRKQDRGSDATAVRSLALRAKARIWNDAAERAGIRIWKNFRIPQHSVIAAAHAAGVSSQSQRLVQADDLGRWHTEAGRPLGSCPIYVTAAGSWATLELAG